MAGGRAPSTQRTVYVKTLKRYAVVPVLVVVIVLLLSLVIVEHNRQSDEDERVAKAHDVASHVQASLETRVSELMGVSRALAGFASGAYRRPPQHNASKEERMEVLDPTRFEGVAKTLYDEFAGDSAGSALQSLQLQPSAIITQVYPLGSGPIGLDLLGTPSQQQDILNSIITPGGILAGPLFLQQGYWGLIAREPVFVGRPRDISTYWGNGAVVVHLERFLDKSGIHAILNTDYVYVLEFTDANTKERVRFSNSTAATNMEGMIYRRVRLPNKFHWDLWIERDGGVGVAIGSDDIAALVSVATGVLVLGFALLIIFAWSAEKARLVDELEREKAELSHLIIASQTTVPRGRVGLLFTDIEDGTSKWSAHPAEMSVALKVHNAIIRDATKTHRGYEVRSTGDAFFIVTAPAAVLKLAADVQRQMHAQQWPAALGELRLRVGVHIGHPDISLEDSKEYDYSGSDVVLAATIAAAATGGQILVSESSIHELCGRLPPGTLTERKLEKTVGDGQRLTLTELVLDNTYSSPTVKARTMKFSKEAKASADAFVGNATTEEEERNPAKKAFDVIVNASSTPDTRARQRDLRYIARVIVTAMLVAVDESQRTAVITHISRGLSVTFLPMELTKGRVVATRLGNRLAQICDGHVQKMRHHSAILGGSLRRDEPAGKESCGSCQSCLVGETCTQLTSNSSDSESPAGVASDAGSGSEALAQNPLDVLARGE